MRKNIMKRAWEIRRKAAQKHGCKVSEINMSECLKMAWAETKKENKKEIEKGFKKILLTVHPDKHYGKDTFQLANDFTSFLMKVYQKNEAESIINNHPHSLQKLGFYIENINTAIIDNPAQYQFMADMCGVDKWYC